MKTMTGNASPGSRAFSEKGPETTIRMNTETILKSMLFSKDSIEKHISNSLTDKMNKTEANLVAFEIGQLINSAGYKNGLTIEERAINREKGLRLAEYFSLTYFDDFDEGKVFLEHTKDFAEHDEKLDKGYYFWDGQAYESYKPHPLDMKWQQWKRGGALPYNYKDLIAFEVNKKMIEETINTAKRKVSNYQVANILREINHRFGMIQYAMTVEPTPIDTEWDWDIDELYCS